LKKKTNLDEFVKEALEQGLSYRQAQVKETLALLKEGKLEKKKAGTKRGSRKKRMDKTS